VNIKPSFEEFCNLPSADNMAAFSMEISTDMDTAVSVYYKLVGEKNGFIFESVDMNKNYGRYSFIGARPYASVELYKEKAVIHEGEAVFETKGNPADSLKKYLSRYHVTSGSEPLVNGGAIGFFNYESVATFERVRGLELSSDKLLGQFMLCRVLLVMDHIKHTSRLIYLVKIDKDEDKEKFYNEKKNELKKIYDDFQNAVVPRREPIPDNDANLFADTLDGAAAEYMAQIRKAKEYIAAGDIFQVVLSHQFSCNLTKPPFYFYRRLRQINPSPYMFYMKFGDRKLIGASPEMLVKVSGDTVYTYPIAGTRKRGKDMAEDKILAADMLSDVKECAEHAMLVDLGRNDIGRVSEAGTVEVTKLMEIEKFSHVMHMVSEVKGKVLKKYHALDVLKACFPAGTVSGAPKARAMEIINELEQKTREAYAGCVGYVDFSGNLDMCIAIRTIRVEGQKAYLQVGAGIVADSVPENEYREIMQKAAVMFAVVKEVENSAIIN
jgi:anthranilate synthase component 1